MSELVTAAQVRAYWNADPKRLDRLSPAARKTVQYDSEGRAPRGRLHPEAFEKARGNAKGYAPGNSRTVAKDNAKAALRVRKAAARKGARKGIQVGSRGPIPVALLPKV